LIDDLRVEQVDNLGIEQVDDLRVEQVDNLGIERLDDLTVVNGVNTPDQTAFKNRLKASPCDFPPPGRSNAAEPGSVNHHEALCPRLIDRKPWTGKRLEFW
jgi:hypothetical protein